MAPFGFRQMEFLERLLFAGITSLISAISVICVVHVLKNLFPVFANEEHWVVWKEVLLFLIVTTVICFLIFMLITVLRLSDESLLVVFTKVVLYTLAISVFPISLLVLFEQYNHQRELLTQAKALTDHIHSSKNNPSDFSKTLQMKALSGENGKLVIRLSAKSILYLKSEGNYVEVFYLDKYQKMQKQLIRNRLKSLIELLPEKCFFHCHKSYVVNGLYVNGVTGNARNYELIVNHLTENIPVSRARSSEVHEFLKSLH